MKSSLLSLSVLSLLSSPLFVSSLGRSSHDAVRLQDIGTLVFSSDAKTTARRSSPIPQMSCIGGSCEYAPSTAACKNIGFDGRDVTWKCECELPKGIRLGPVTVSCEGFGYADDPNVLVGSCGLEYKLEGHAVKDDVRNYEQQQPGVSMPSRYDYSSQAYDAAHHVKQKARHWWQSASEIPTSAYNYAYSAGIPVHNFYDGYQSAHKYHRSLLDRIGLGHDSYLPWFGSGLLWMTWSWIKNWTKLAVLILGLYTVWKLTRASANNQHANHATNRPPQYDDVYRGQQTRQQPHVHEMGSTPSFFSMFSGGSNSGPSKPVNSGSSWTHTVGAGLLGYLLGKRGQRSQQQQHMNANSAPWMAQPTAPFQAQPNYAHGSQDLRHRSQPVPVTVQQKAVIDEPDVEVKTAYGGTKRR